MDWFDTILSPIMWVVAWIMVHIYKLLSAIHINDDVAWVASIVALVIFMRALLIPLFVRQIRASRGLQVIQPEMQKIQKKYKGKTDPASRQKMQEEMMALYRESGTNPFSSCWPVLLQSPIFFALFRVLYSLPQISTGARDAIGPLDQHMADLAEHATLFGAPLSATFMQADNVAAPFSPVTVRIVTVILIVLMSLTTFTTQRQLTMKNMPQAALDNPMARQQKMLVYIMPFVFFISGPNFPIGVLIYWLTTNMWTMGQQYFVIRRMPAPGSEAERRMKERKQRKSGAVIDVIEEAKTEEQPGGQRQQPMSKARQKKKGPRPTAQPSSGAAQQGQAKDSPSTGGSKSGESQPTAQQPGGSTSDDSQPETGKSGGAKPGAGKSGAGKPGAGKPGSGKPGAGKPGAGSSGGPQAPKPKDSGETGSGTKKPGGGSAQKRKKK